jgi:CRISPR-associated protein Cmr4
MIALSNRQTALLIAFAVTPVHAGVGQEFGAVDLPIQRDTMNYPVIYSSSLKGALKHECAERHKEITVIGKVNRVRDGGTCARLFGSDAKPESGRGLVSFTDLRLLLVPARSLERGPIYLTTHYMIDSARDLLALVGSDIGAALGSALAALRNSEGAAETLNVLGAALRAFSGPGILPEKIFERKPPLYELLSSAGIAVAPDHVELGGVRTDASVLVNRALVRVSRNRLDLVRKTVIEGALWTEEYLPQGSLLVGLAQGDVDGLRGAFGGDFYITLGGKETVGRGILRIVLH